MISKNKAVPNTFLIIGSVLIFTFISLCCLVTTVTIIRLNHLQKEVENLREQIAYNTGQGDRNNVQGRPKREVVGVTSDGIIVRSENYAQQKRLNINRERYPDYTGLSVTYMPAQASYIGSNPTINFGATRKPIVHPRKSRVMNLENTSRPYRDVKLSELKSGDSLYTSNEQSDNTESREETYTTNRRRKQRLETLDERHPRTGRIKPLPSIHFSGDTSKYVFGTHENFNGNGHLRHPQRTFVDWKANNWVEKTGMNTHFSLDEGYLTIKESGIYFIYAQIYYLDEHDMNGYRVYKNNETILQCTTFSNSNRRTTKGSTCYTAAAEYLAEGDNISLGDLSDGRYSLFEPGKSFFGLIKLGDVKARR